MATSTKKASRTPQEMLDLLEANFDLRLDTDGLSELVGRKLTDRSRISQTDEELYDIHAQSVAAAQRAAEDAEEAEAAEAIKSSPSGLTGRNVIIGQLLNHYRQLVDRAPDQ